MAKALSRTRRAGEAKRWAGCWWEGVEVGGAERGGAVGVAPANIRWSRPGKPGEIVAKVKGRLAVPVAELFRLLPHKFASFLK